MPSYRHKHLGEVGLLAIMLYTYSQLCSIYRLLELSMLYTYSQLCSIYRLLELSMLYTYSQLCSMHIVNYAPYILLRLSTLGRLVQSCKPHLSRVAYLAQGFGVRGPRLGVRGISLVFSGRISGV